MLRLKFWSKIRRTLPDNSHLKSFLTCLILKKNISFITHFKFFDFHFLFFEILPNLSIRNAHLEFAIQSLVLHLYIGKHSNYLVEERMNDSWIIQNVIQDSQRTIHSPIFSTMVLQLFCHMICF